MPRVRRTTATLLVAGAALTLTACGRTDAPDDRTAAAGTPTAATATPSPSVQTPVPARDPAQDEQMRIGITIGDQRFMASLDDSAATRDLADQLPVNVQMVDHGGVEKTGRLPSPLSLDGQPHGADPDVGDVGYYAPGNDLVLYYGNQSYYDGIVVLGRLNGDAAARIAAIDGPVTATVETVDH